MSTYLHGTFDCMFSSCHVRVSEWIHTLHLLHSGNYRAWIYSETLKRVRDMMKRYSQMHRTDKYSQHSSIISLVWLMFVYKLSGCGFEFRCSHLKIRYRGCFEQGDPWHWDNYRVWIFCSFKVLRNVPQCLSVNFYLGFINNYFVSVILINFPCISWSPSITFLRKNDEYDFS